jgi:hypothetical protein
VRSGPSTAYDTLRFVSRNDILPVLDAEAVGGWWHVCPDGFVSADYVRFEAATPQPTATATARPVVIVTQTPRATPTRILHQFVYCRKGSIIVTSVAGMELVECEVP